jgi:hypothetical protein
VRSATGAVDTAVHQSGKCPLDRRQVMAEKRTTGYGRRWKKWLAIYAIAGTVAYLIVYLVFFADGGGAGGAGGLY